jgi:predicted RNA polymerase sigma factor
MLKTERLAVKVLPAHKLALARIAQAEDTSEATIVRRLIRAEAERRHVWFDDPTTTGWRGRPEHPNFGGDV